MPVTIHVDNENNSDEFWGHLDERFPEIAQVLREYDRVRVRDEDWDAIQALPGFANGPDHAREALYVSQ